MTFEARRGERRVTKLRRELQEERKMGKLLFATAAVLALISGASANEEGYSPDRCTTNAYDGFVNVKSLPSATGNVVGQLPNGVITIPRDRFVDLEGTTWLWVEAGSFKGWARGTSLSCMS
jgi:hypothetical protein